MANKKNSGLNFSVNAPKMKAGGGGSNANPLQSLMLLQMRSQAGQQGTPGEVASGRTDPLTGQRTVTQQGQDFEIQQHIRQKASEDAVKTSSVLPLLDDLEKTYREAYADIIGESGISGGVSAAKEYGMGVLLRKNQALRTLEGKLKTYRPAFVRASGDSGNFSVVEQQAAGESLPRLAPFTSGISNLFLPDDPVQGLARIQSMRELYTKKYMEQVRVAETGDFRGTGYETNMGSGNGGIEAERQQAIQAIQSGKNAKKVADIFRSRTGQELNV